MSHNERMDNNLTFKSHRPVGTQILLKRMEEWMKGLTHSMMTIQMAIQRTVTLKRGAVLERGGTATSPCTGERESV